MAHWQAPIFEFIPNNAEGIAAFAECLYELPADAKCSIARDRWLYKNGNLYFSADILFPWAIYYLYVLQAISDVPCSSSWFENIDFDYAELRAGRDAALIRYFVQLLWECVLTLLPSNVFHVIWDYTRTFAHTEFYISYPDLYLEWLCHYWTVAAKSRETRISLLLMLFPELKPNWATISMKTARLHRTLLTNTVTASLEKLTGIGLCSQ